ncbi:3-beta hydroxysteroid dehydrogenase/isomerase [Penicillium cataractarum]|uniref:3-beta hydroxysteroid dehydrogenase/isomerase n=1 Tax=Penicillium cataractarum TaxID=2100454 RepID=A0A9X0B5L8_9EURO|nr:3-beta hydroxysteroid dehydrogenase/isomerase [Penicillium cataractarum]KAJ5388985.1 3-beta hydroxysteroid dehydrogenase/isomerase [Penicillium cataractarum]
MTQVKERAIHHGPKVLVTGANGYIASHIINVLLELGYTVRGTVRAEMTWLDDYFLKQWGPNRFESVLVPDFQQPHAFDECVQGVSGIIHVAQALPSSPLVEDVDEAVAYTVNGSVNLLQAASLQTSVKRVVFTSSIVAAGYPKGPGFKLDKDSWDDCVSGGASLLAQRSAYRECKAQGEFQAWKWVEKNRPGFEFNTVLPWFTLGKVLHPEIGGSTMGYVTRLLQGNTQPFKFLPLPWFVDVVDTARLHAIALFCPNVKSERLFAAATPFVWKEIIDILRQIQPNNTTIPNPPSEEDPTVGEVKPAIRAAKLLYEYFGQSSWTSIEKSLEGGIEENP